MARFALLEYLAIGAALWMIVVSVVLMARAYDEWGRRRIIRREMDVAPKEPTHPFILSRWDIIRRRDELARIVGGDEAAEHFRRLERWLNDQERRPRRGRP